MLNIQNNNLFNFENMLNSQNQNNNLLNIQNNNLFNFETCSILKNQNNNLLNSSINKYCVHQRLKDENIFPRKRIFGIGAETQSHFLLALKLILDILDNLG